MQAGLNQGKKTKGAPGDLSSHQPWPFILLLITMTILRRMRMRTNLTRMTMKDDLKAWCTRLLIYHTSLPSLYSSTHYHDNTDEDDVAFFGADDDKFDEDDNEG